MNQFEAAHKLEVSPRTLSLWECDRVYPTWGQQPAVTNYLGYDPFTDPTLGGPGSNKPPVVAILGKKRPLTEGQQFQKWRLQKRKTRKQLAYELGVSVKTLWGWETDRHQPNKSIVPAWGKVLGIIPVGN